MDQSKHTNIIIGILVLIIIGLFAVLYAMRPTSVLTEQTVTPQTSTSSKSAATSGTNTGASSSGTGSKTTTRTTSSSGSTAPKTTTAAPKVPDSTTVVVTYTDSGFVPPVVEVEQGKSITFINSSSKPMWVTSEYQPAANAAYYPAFNQSKSVGPGGTFTFSFTKIGVWGYKNLNYPNHLGAVSVIAQKQ